MYKRKNVRAGGAWIWIAVLLLAATGCSIDELLKVNDPDIVTPEQAAGPAAVPATVAGMVGDFQISFGNYAIYAALFTDEMILAGTFPTRIDVDERNVQLDPNNGTLEADMFGPFQVARESADRNLASWTGALDDPAYASVKDNLEEGFALANLYGGYLRAMMAEAYCSVVLEPKGEPVTPAAAMEAALARLQQTQSVATQYGLTDIATAARVGQARALMYLGRYSEAAAAAASVPEDFVFMAEYSDNQSSQYNVVHAYTWGVNPFVLRWTVGDGTAGNRHNELWPYFQEWIDQGLLVDDPPGYEAVEIGIGVALQLAYDAPGRSIPVATGWEAQMDIAEAELRSGQVAQAQARVNGLLANPALNPLKAMNPDLPLGAFTPVSFTGTLATDLPQMARARASGLWLNTDRQATLRRYYQNDGIDLYPTGTQGSDVSFPIPQQEIDNNPHVSGGCG